ncbi:MAG: archaeal proteasome endopeptidase complex subunit alpha [Promethearchaeota archaeon]
MFSEPGRGYDVAPTMFSPKGRLFQVEYAIEAVRKGALIVGAISVKDDAVVLVAEKRLLPLQEEKYSGSEKIWIIDEHIMAAISGLTADARVLIDHARVKAQVYRLSYDIPIGIEDIAKEIGDQCQYFTQFGGARPYGVSLLIGGIDPKKGAKLYNTDPSGSFWGFYACAVGNNYVAARQVLEKKYNKSLSLEQTIELCFETLKSVLEEDLKPIGFDISYITKKDMSIKYLSDEEKQKLIDKFSTKISAKN